MHVPLGSGGWEEAAQAYRAQSEVLPSPLPAASLSPARIESLREARRRLESDVDQGKVGSQAGRTLDQVLAGDDGGVGGRLPPPAIVGSSTVRGDRDATELAELIRSGQVSAADMVEACLARTIAADAALNCVAELLAERARTRARQLDATLASPGGKPVGPLHGVPMSIKAHVGLEETGTDRGFVFDVLDPASTTALLADGSAATRGMSAAAVEHLRMQGPHLSEQDAWVASKLQSAGAIVVAKTTMPQSVMQLDTRSNLHGQTFNPCNVHLSPGGSSGGESALVASGATALGIGTDIGGSIRQPAACTGIYGLRPTCGRLTMAGIRSTMKGNEGIIGTCGPFAHSARDLRLVMSVLCSSPDAPWEVDPFSCPELPWRGATGQARRRRLRVGVMRSDGVVRPTAPVEAGLERVVAALRASDDVELVTYDPLDLHARGWAMARELYFLEGGAVIRALADVTGEPLLPLTEYILSPPVRDHTANEVWTMNARREALKREFWRRWKALELDVLLCPPYAAPAPRPGTIRYWGYTSFFNLVDFPGVVFPSGVRADSSVDRQGGDPGAAQNAETGPFESEAHAEFERHQTAFDGAPIGVQLIGARWKEEELLDALDVIERAMDRHSAQAEIPR